MNVTNITQHEAEWNQMQMSVQHSLSLLIALLSIFVGVWMIFCVCTCSKQVHKQGLNGIKQELVHCEGSCVSSKAQQQQQQPLY